MGGALAGLFVVESLLLEPTLFRRYIALSPGVWWNRGELIRNAERLVGALNDSERTLYLSAANEAGIAEGTARLFRAVVPGAFAEVLQ